MISRKGEKEEKQKLEEQQKKTRKGMSAAGAMVMVVGIVGLLIFGYLFYLNFAQGGLNSVTTVADGVGLILSGMLAAAGTYGKWK